MDVPQASAGQASLPAAPAQDSVPAALHVGALQWSEDDVSAWLRSVRGLEEYATKFASFGVDGAMLFDLDETSVMDMFEMNMFHAKKLLRLRDKLPR